MKSLTNKIKLEDILTLIEKHQTTAYELSQNTDFSAVGIQKIIDGDTKKPQQATINAIYNYIVNKYENQNQLIIPENHNDESVKMIPFYDIDFYSGFTHIFNNQTIKPTNYFYLPEFHDAELAIRNSGRSMKKELGDDDILGLKQVHNWGEFFNEGEIYAVVTSNDFRTIKRVRWSDKEHTKLILIPKPLAEDKFDYPEYQEINANLVLALFKVVAHTNSKRLVI